METYKYTHCYNLISDYVQPTNLDDWLECPVCDSKPLVWEFDNGRYASCKCHNNMYDHRIIRAESVGEYYRRNNESLIGYGTESLLTNWNHWVRTGEMLTNKRIISMNTYTTEFSGYRADGGGRLPTVALIIAEDIHMAKLLLEQRLASIGLAQSVDITDIKQQDNSTRRVDILLDGEY